MINRIGPRPSRWKSRLIGVIVLLAALAGVAGYFHLYPDALPEWAAKTPFGRELQTTTVYKWQDAAGDWHITDQPPPEGIAYEVEHYTPDVNVLPLPPKMQQ